MGQQRLGRQLFVVAFAWIPIFVFSQTSASPPIIENITATAEPQGITLEIALTAPYTPQPLQLTNPDRSVFDFPGYGLPGGNRRIAVNRGPVLQVRASLFHAQPPIARIVIDSKEPLKLAVKPAGNKVIVEITFASERNPSPAPKTVPTNTGAPRKQPAPTPTPGEPKQRTLVSTASRPTAYSLQAKAKALHLEDLQPLEDKATAGDPEAQTMLALAYHDAILLRSNDAEALRLLHQAADHGFMAAEESLGIFLERGFSLSQPNPLEAIAWYKKAAQQGSLDAATNIALMYADGIGIPKDPAQALPWFRQAAEGGDATAQYNLALMYEHGKVVPRDMNEYLRWLNAAADQNVVPALLDLGAHAMHPPDGDKPDLTHAMHCYEKAGDLGSASAQAIMGNIYASGMLGKPDYEQALTWYRKGAAQGQRDAQYGLGVRYARGEGVPVDKQEARRLFTIAADHGLAEAQLGLGILLEQGDGGPADRTKAAHYYELAANQGSAAAQFRLGVLLSSYKESSSDRVAAYKWLMLAQPSIPESAKRVNDIKKFMNADDLASAERQIDAWKKLHPQK